MTNQITINNQVWEEITPEEYKDLVESSENRIFIFNKFYQRYYKLLPPPEVYPKIFGKYEVDSLGVIRFDEFNAELSWIIMSSDTDKDNLKLAIAESEKIRSREE